MFETFREGCKDLAGDQRSRWMLNEYKIVQKSIRRQFVTLLGDLGKSKL
jgi:hypothetical protein